MLDVTPKLLWIDSLCIIQDSVEDWEVESAKMAAMYSGANITIDVSSATQPSQSLFADRWICGVPLCSGQGLGLRMRTDTVSVIQHQGHKFRFIPSNYRIHESVEQLRHNNVSDEIDAPLTTRAWAFQERLLSPFTLHFHSSEMVWECGTSTRCECSIIDDSQERTKYRASVSRLKLGQGFVEMSGSDSWKVENIWQHHVSVYSSLWLTRESDWLVALSGLAAQVHHKSFRQYVAGIWTGTLPAAFLYCVLRSGTATVPTESELKISLAPRLKAPSLSWASVPLGGDSTITYNVSTSFDVRDACPEFKILNTVYTLSSRNPYG
jgi:hypothetical protein